MYKCIIICKALFMQRPYSMASIYAANVNAIESFGLTISSISKLDTI